MTCERRLCVAILARISDTCQESVPLFHGEGAGFVFSLNIFHNGKHCESLTVIACRSPNEASIDIPVTKEQDSQTIW